MRIVLARAFTFLTALLLLGYAGPEAKIPDAGGYSASIEWGLQWIEYMGVFAVGWGTGVLIWMSTAHQALRCFLFDLPQGWTLWQHGVLTSVIPASKYLAGGLLFLGTGAVLAWYLMGPWSQAFYVGLLAGGIAGAIWSLEKGWEGQALVDFLLRNRRYVDEDKVPMIRFLE